MSYTLKIKEEIAAIKSTKSEMIAELSGYIRNNGHIENKTIVMSTENTFLIDRFKSFLETLYEIDLTVKEIGNLNFSKKRLYSMIIDTKQDLILKDIGYYDKDNNYLETPPEYIVGANEEIRAYLRGVFQAVGSVNDPNKSRYHMELLILKPKESVFVQKLLNIFELNSKILYRKKGYMIYIKEA